VDVALPHILKMSEMPKDRPYTCMMSCRLLEPDDIPNAFEVFMKTNLSDLDDRIIIAPAFFCYIGKTIYSRLTKIG
jgi:hypothetical protein